MTKFESIRRNAGFTIAQLSEKSGVSAPTIVKIEGGRIENTRIGTLVQLADALGCDIKDFF